MSWTDANTVKTHLLGFAVDALKVRGVEATLEEFNPVQLTHRNLLSGSVRVAALEMSEPQGPVAISLTGTTWYPLGTTDLLPGSLTLADNSRLETLYIENVDYAVRHESGEVKRLPGSSIPEGVQIQAWFLPLNVYDWGNDYSVDHAAGTVMRVIGTSLPDPARVIVDYTTNAAASTDSLIARVITEAEDKITARLREEYSPASTDEGLKTGATELTLAMICDDLALHALETGTDASADDRARRLMDLAHRYEARAAATLARFLTQPLPSEATLLANPTTGAGW